MKNKSIVSFILIFLSGWGEIWSQAASSASGAAGNDTLRTILLVISIVLFLIIIVLGSTLSASYKNYINNKISKGGGALSLIGTSAIFTLSLVFPTEMSAQSIIDFKVWSSLPYDIWIYLAVIFLQLVVIIFMSNKIRSFIRTEVKTEEVEQESWLVRWFSRLNNFKPIEEEAKFDVGHDYDGIRELDNNTPAWWSYTFLFCILFAGVYMYRYHVAHSAPLPLEELKIAQDEAAIQKAEYLKNAAESIDETNVTMSDAAGLSIGAELYTKNCVVCHGDKGQGGIGPNLTDDYWIHKGSLKDIFYSVKYGWPQNGMKAWSEDFSPSQIAHVSSYVKTLVGTNPPNPKDKQGELYKEDGEPGSDVKEIPAEVDTSVVK
jgi:cytochrome c oxidase cbb3-type subunit 3